MRHILVAVLAVLVLAAPAAAQLTIPTVSPDLLERATPAPAPSTDWVMVGAVVGYGTCVVVDALTSGAAIASGNGAEGNPVYAGVQDNYFRFGLRRGALASITPVASYFLWKKGGRTGRVVAKALLGSTAAAYCYIGKRNADIAERSRR